MLTSSNAAGADVNAHILSIGGGVPHSIAASNASSTSSSVLPRARARACREQCLVRELEVGAAYAQWIERMLQLAAAIVAIARYM